MADRMQWHGHRLSALPEGESWLSGGERRSAPEGWVADPWPFDAMTELDALETGHSQPQASASEAGDARSNRGGLALALLGVAAIITIMVARRSGPPDEPAPLPAPPSQTISSLTRAHLTPVTAHVGDYINFQLPAGRSYEAALEQPGSQTPVVEQLNVPGQEPQLRIDSVGNAVVEVMSSPVCASPNGCPDQSELIGGIQISVQP